MIDMHTHILAGMDDGAADNDISLAMAKLAVQDGISRLVATPHMMKGAFDISKSSILTAVETLNELLHHNVIHLSVLPGAEYYIEPDLPRQYVAGEVLSINDADRYILVELPSGFIPDYSAKVFYELQLLGLIPIIAHPERNACLAGNPKILKNFCERGCLSQITAASITGLFGSRVEKAAWNLMSLGLVHAIASDAHSNNGRAPVLSGAVAEVEKRWGKDLAMTLVKDNPERIIEGLPVEQLEFSTGRRWSWLMKLSGSFYK